MSSFKAKAVVEPMDIYQAHAAISGSKIREFQRSPLHFKMRYIDGVVKDPTPAQAFGALAHTAILEPHLFLDNYVIKPKFSGVGMKKAKEDWEAGLKQGALVMDQDEANDIVGMIHSVQNYKIAADLLKKGVAELSLYYEDDVTGLPIKTRPDYVTEDGWIVNLKTCKDARRSEFMKAVANYGYNIGAAMMLEAYKKVYGREAKGYVFVAAEHTAPYPVGVYVADSTVTETGALAVRRNLDKMKVCFDKGQWLFQEQAENIAMPNWAMYDEEYKDL